MFNKSNSDSLKSLKYFEYFQHFRVQVHWMSFEFEDEQNFGNFFRIKTQPAQSWNIESRKQKAPIQSFLFPIDFVITNTQTLLQAHKSANTVLFKKLSSTPHKFSLQCDCKLMKAENCINCIILFSLFTHTHTHTILSTLVFSNLLFLVFICAKFSSILLSLLLFIPFRLADYLKQLSQSNAWLEWDFSVVRVEDWLTLVAESSKCSLTLQNASVLNKILVICFSIQCYRPKDNFNAFY